MNMKNILILVFSLIISSQSFSQYNYFVDERIQNTYSKEIVQELVKNNLNEIKWLNWFLDNGYTIMDVGLPKCENLAYLKYINRQTKEIGENVLDIDFSDMNNFNLFLYNIECNYNKATTYRIGDTGKILIIRARKDLEVEFNKILSNEN